jgi:NDP-sugar pyrophosphorylase family protein/aminoglycoside/choline kinase family phosphotransferase
MTPPRKAVVLAAGYGARLLSLTLCRPKPLCPVWGKPVLVHALERLREWGVRDVLINVHCHSGKIVEYLRLHPVPGLHCQISFEADVLGTGGVLPHARWFFDDNPFWMMNADVLAEVPCVPLLKAFESHAALAALWLIPDSGPRTVETEGQRITTFRSTRPGSPGTATFSGLHLLSPRILKFLPSEGETSIVSAYERAMKAGETVAGVRVPESYWADIGTPESYLQAHRDIAERTVSGRPGRSLYSGSPLTAASIRQGVQCMGRNVAIAPSARVSNTVIWDDVKIGEQASVNNAIIADKVSLRGTVSYMALRADTLADPELDALLRRLGWPAEKTTVFPLPPRGSARTFTRIQCGRRKAIIVRYSLERPENGLYVRHARFLAGQGLRVPAVLLDRPEAQVCVLEDAGLISLQELVPTLSPRRCLGLYRQVLDNVIRLHGPAGAAARRQHLPLSQPFTRQLYRWEQDLFCEQFLGRHTKLAAGRLAMVRQELASLIPVQVRASRVLVHRDLQSSNVLVAGGETVLIDFQGMRFGTAAYDLASLLCDPYVSLSPAIRSELLDYYASRARGGEAARQLFWVAAIERLAQALGAYGRLGTVPATAYFLRYIPAGVGQLLEATRQVGTLPVLQEVLATWLATSKPTPPAT